jgi:SAM-dependent MidA family methyltransferase
MTRFDAALPPPTADALAASEALAARIAARLDAEGGWLGFDTYMAMALYEPALGYYAGGSRKLGAAGDFVTAPELGGLFGACLARQCAAWFMACAPRVIEFGAGSGALAAQLLEAFERLGLREVEYLIVELSGELAARQRERLARDCPAALPRVRWLSALPERIEGVVIGNEVLDAMPVRAFAVAPVHGGAPRVLERGVVRAGSGFAWGVRDAPEPLARQVLARLAQGAGIDDVGAHACVGEIGEQAEAWVGDVGRRLVRGAMLLIDYGFARPAYFHVQRTMGTLMCHYRHRAHGDPFLLPGLQDITAHVDFTAIAQAGLDAGLTVLGFTSQARLLLDLGVLDELAARLDGVIPPGARVRETQAAQQLLSEAEMGELFKALALGRGLDDPGPGFARGDRPLALPP